jgi:fermentation-respiration switch protein FrsA (DUF1100 family)
MSILSALLHSRSFGWRAVRILILVVVGLAACIVMFENKFIYFPSKYPDGGWDIANTPAREGDENVPVVEDCWFVASDGVKLHGWYSEPKINTLSTRFVVDTQPVLLWFHGNAGNVTDRYEMLRMLVRLPARILIIDYRGYGKSEGSPSESGLYKDARGAWDYLLTTRNVRPDRIIIFGESLGGAIAIELATHVPPAGLIIQSSFTCIADMAATVIPGFPSFLLRTKMNSLEKISRVPCAKLFIHSHVDEVVPYRLGRRLFEAAHEPKQFYEVPGAGHNDTYIVGGHTYITAIREFTNFCLR